MAFSDLLDPFLFARMLILQFLIKQMHISYEVKMNLRNSKAFNFNVHVYKIFKLVLLYRMLILLKTYVDHLDVNKCTQYLFIICDILKYLPNELSK